MVLFSTLLVSLGTPSSDVPYAFKTMSVEPPLREVRFSGGKRGRYLVRGDRAGEVTALVAAELLGATLAAPAQAAELVDTLEKPLPVPVAKKALAALGAKPVVIEAGEGVLWAQRVYARTTPTGGGTLVITRHLFGPRPSRTETVLYLVEPAVPIVPSAPPPLPSKDVDAFWRAVQSPP